ncbi:MAG: hypothetical protein AAFN41_13300, partial [Planctomycetota bacterium]
VGCGIYLDIGPLVWLEIVWHTMDGVEYRWIEICFNSCVLEAEEERGNARSLIGGLWEIASGCGAHRVMHLWGEDNMGVVLELRFGAMNADFDLQTVRENFGNTFVCWAPAADVSPASREAGGKVMARAVGHDFARLHARAGELGYVPTDLSG